MENARNITVLLNFVEFICVSKCDVIGINIKRYSAAELCAAKLPLLPPKVLDCIRLDLCFHPILSMLLFS